MSGKSEDSKDEEPRGSDNIESVYERKYRDLGKEFSSLMGIVISMVEEQGPVGRNLNLLRQDPENSPGYDTKIVISEIRNEMLSMNRMMSDNLDGKLANLKREMSDNLDGKLANLKREMIDNMDEKLANLETGLVNKMGILQVDIEKKLDEQDDRIGKRIDQVEASVTDLRSRIEKLAEDSEWSFKESFNKIDLVIFELSLIKEKIEEIKVNQKSMIELKMA